MSKSTGSTGSTELLETPRNVFILSGGLSAGKTVITRRLIADFHYASGSPADVMKAAAARAIAMQLNGNDDDWEAYFFEMNNPATKEEYRPFLQGYGEWFSNRNGNYWADQCVEAAAQQYDTLAKAGLPTGIVFDSMRRPHEIIAVKNRWANAVHVHLVTTHERQMEYLTTIRGLSEALAENFLAHSSEHWLDDMEGTPYDADYFVDATGGDEKTWIQLMGIVVLEMKQGVTLEPIGPVEAGVIDPYA